MDWPVMTFDVMQCHGIAPLRHSTSWHLQRTKINDTGGHPNALAFLCSLVNGSQQSVKLDSRHVLIPIPSTGKIKSSNSYIYIYSSTFWFSWFRFQQKTGWFRNQFRDSENRNRTSLLTRVLPKNEKKQQRNRWPMKIPSVLT